jgi:thiol-disulfide isomerase/thioredoxin/YHS domain-containing protein
MRKLRGIFLSVLVPTMLLSEAVAQPIRWDSSVEHAKRLAAQTNRLVMLEFGASWCQACRAMENEVLSLDSVGAVVNASYVPVKINIEYFPTLAKQYGVSLLPTTLVIQPTPRGEVVSSLQGRQTPDNYMGWLTRVAASQRRSNQMYAQIPTGPPPPTAERAAAVPPAAPAAVPDAARYNAPPSQSQIVAAYAPAPALVPATGAAGDQSLPVTDSPPKVPPLALDGYCPVRLTEKSQWTTGNPAWGAIHRGRTYLFVGAEEQRRFLADPDRYAPVCSGADVVLAVDQGRTQSGEREHGLFFRGRIYLFQNEESLERFAKNPNFYLDRLRESMQASANWPQQAVR